MRFICFCTGGGFPAAAEAPEGGAADFTPEEASAALAAEALAEVDSAAAASAGAEEAAAEVALPADFNKKSLSAERKFL